MHTLAKIDLANEFAQKTQYPPAYSKQIVEDLVGVIQSAIFARKTVYIPQLCRINVIVKAPRIGRNPKTGEPYPITERHSITASKTGDKGIQAGKLGKIALINKLVSLGHEHAHAVRVVEAFYRMVGLVSEGEHRIEIRGLGVFYPRKIGSGIRRNPKTGHRKLKNARISVAFKCSPTLRKAMDKEYLSCPT